MLSATARARDQRRNTAGVRKRAATNVATARQTAPTVGTRPAAAPRPATRSQSSRQRSHPHRRGTARRRERCPRASRIWSWDNVRCRRAGRTFPRPDRRVHPGQNPAIFTRTRRCGGRRTRRLSACSNRPNDRCGPRTYRGAYVTELPGAGWTGSIQGTCSGSGTPSMFRFTTTGSWPLRATTHSNGSSSRALISWCGT